MKGKLFREGSPPSGFSTLITSAPRSARSMVQNGPAKAQVISRTRTPSKGPGIETPHKMEFRNQNPGVRIKRADAQTDFVLRQAQHERKRCMISMAMPFALSLSKGERGLG